MNHKRGKAKNQRAGCLMCKPHKMNGAGGRKLKTNKAGFGSIRAVINAAKDEKE